MISGIQKAPHYAGQLKIVVERFLSVSIKKSYMREIGKLIEYDRLVSVLMVFSRADQVEHWISIGFRIRIANEKID